MSYTVVGVMGPGNEALESDIHAGFELGKLIAEQGWVLLTGGRNEGVMDASNKGAKENGGLTVGILPGSDKSELSSYVDIPVITGMGSARNNINVLSSNVVIACGTGKGTMSEILLGIKISKHVIVLNQSQTAAAFLEELRSEFIHFAPTPSEAISIVIKLLI